MSKKTSILKKMIIVAEITIILFGIFATTVSMAKEYKWTEVVEKDDVEANITYTYDSGNDQLIAKYTTNATGKKEYSIKYELKEDGTYQLEDSSGYNYLLPHGINRNDMIENNSISTDDRKYKLVKITSESGEYTLKYEEGVNKNYGITDIYTENGGRLDPSDVRYSDLINKWQTTRNVPSVVTEEEAQNLEDETAENPYSVDVKTQADGIEAIADIGGVLLNPIIDILMVIPDTIIAALQTSMNALDKGSLDFKDLKLSNYLIRDDKFTGTTIETTHQTSSGHTAGGGGRTFGETGERWRH